MSLSQMFYCREHSSKLFPVQPTLTANCWAKTSLLVPYDCRCPVTTLVNRTLQDKPGGDKKRIPETRDAGSLGKRKCWVGSSVLWSSVLDTQGDAHGSPVLKQLFAWTFKDQAQDQAPGIRKLQSMPGWSVPAKRNKVKRLPSKPRDISP